jgi:hypothetical protein
MIEKKPKILNEILLNIIIQKNKTMKNPVSDYFKNISNADLKSVIVDIIHTQTDESGRISNLVTQHARNISAITNTIDLHLTQITLLKEASVRWVLTQMTDSTLFPSVIKLLTF